MANSVAVVGLGQLGRRYVEGLLQSSTELSVWGVERNPEAIKRTQELVHQPKPHVHVEFLSSIREVPINVDLVISATTADARLSTVREILDGRNVRFVILEKLLTQTVSDSLELSYLATHVQHVWVNYPRRVMVWHRLLSELLRRNTPLRVSVTIGSPGLLTKMLHYIDLIEWWTDSRAQEIQIRGQSLEWFESKRPGFLDATGVVDVTFSDASLLTLHSNPKGSQSSKNSITVNGANTTLSISEPDGIAFGSMLANPIAGRLELQSELTGPLVEQILGKGTCGLPNLEDVISTHDLFISTLLAEQDKKYGAKGRLMVT